MKLPENVSEFNSLKSILEILESKNPVPITVSMLDSIGAALSLGKIECENRDEVFKCLELLHQMGVVQIHKKVELTGISYLIGNIYNGK